jgi:serine phosphatase RsbU (regulator of sigma subunit)
MVCMEVRGGNTPVDTVVSLSGLDAWIYSQPYRHADGGGDVHFVSSCATGRITRLLVADVSGHGAEVDGVARDLRDLMGAFVNYLDQKQFVRAMNQQFSGMATHACFATAVVMTFFAPTRELRLCNAGHPSPLWYRADHKTWEVLDVVDGNEGPSNLPLGVIDASGYEQFDVELGPSDLVLCYTDSLMESKGRDGEMIGTAGLAQLVRDLGVIDPAVLIPKLLLTIASAHPNNLHDDDVTVMLLRPNGTGVKTRFKDKLFAPLRVVRGAVTALRNGRRLPIPEFSVANIGGALIDPLSRWGRRSKARG